MVLIAVQLKHMLNTCTAGRVLFTYICCQLFFKFKLTIILAFMLSHLKIELTRSVIVTFMCCIGTHTNVILHSYVLLICTIHIILYITHNIVVESDPYVVDCTIHSAIGTHRM